MDKPKKKEIPKIKEIPMSKHIHISDSDAISALGYNRAIDDYEKFLPSIDRLAGIIRDWAIKNNCYWATTDHLVNTPIQDIAKAISKRIGNV